MDLKYLYISLTNNCNHSCSICARKEHMRKDRGFMDIQLFERIVDEIPDSVETVYLHKQGESTLHPKLPEMIKLLRNKHPGIKLKLNTNLIILDDKLIEAFVKYVDVLTVSIHSIGRSTYKKLHGSNTFFKSINNLCKINKMAEKTNMELWIDYVIQKGNEHEDTKEVTAYFKDLLGNGFTISYWWCINFMGMGNEGKIDIYDSIPHNIIPLCIFPWVAMTICWDGKIDYCFVDPEEKTFLGDANSATIEEIWAGKDYQRFRKLWLDRDFKAMESKYGIKCRKCSFLWSKQTQNYSLLPEKLYHKAVEHWNEYEATYIQKLAEEGKSLKNFYGWRVEL